MPPLKKPRQEKLAKALASGLPLAKAAKKAGYSGDPANAHRVTRNDQVSQRVEELKAKNESILEISRENFIRTIHARFINEEHRDAPKYGEMLAKACGYNEPEKLDITANMEVEILVGGKRVEY